MSLIRKFDGFSILFCLMLLAAACAPAAVVPPTATQPAATATLAPTATELPSSTPTSAPTATDLPTATAEPTATAVPPLAVVDDGFYVWCAPIDANVLKPTTPDTPTYARLMQTTADGLVASIPGSFCTLRFQLNQPAPEGLTLRFMQGESPVMQLQLAPSPTDPQVVWTTVDHAYVVNPPYWEITYDLALVTADGTELWAQPVKFAKPLPEPCLFGGLPDPVTLYCPITDPLEIEPWPDVTYPYDRSRLTPNP